MTILNPYILISAISLISNIPCGYIRENHPKFSLKWLLWIHASIPLIIYMRLSLGTSPWFIPVCIFLAVIGQIVGSRLRRRQMTQHDLEHLQQIGELNLKNVALTRDDSMIMVVLLNMGGPKTNDDVKDFLIKLFSDSLLIRFPLSGVLQPLFANMLGSIREKEARARYQLIGGGSPIFNSTRGQAQDLKEELNSRGRSLDVTFCFNYSPPFPEDVIKEAQSKDKSSILALSLYPHHSRATTGSSLHYLRKAVAENNSQIEIIESPPYYLHEAYISAFVDRINEQMSQEESLEDFYLVFSAHGLPLYFLREGDPYPFQIAQTVSQVLQKLQRDHSWVISYQSAVGPMEWIKPSTEDVIIALARRGIRKVLVIPISFVTDHIETLCEIDIEYRQLAESRGIEDFRMSRALECHAGLIQALADSIEDALPATVNKSVSA